MKLTNECLALLYDKNSKKKEDMSNQDDLQTITQNKKSLITP